MNKLGFDFLQLSTLEEGSKEIDLAALNRLVDTFLKQEKTTLMS